MLKTFSVSKFLDSIQFKKKVFQAICYRLWRWVEVYYKHITANHEGKSVAAIDHLKHLCTSRSEMSTSNSMTEISMISFFSDSWYLKLQKESIRVLASDSAFDIVHVLSTQNWLDDALYKWIILSDLYLSLCETFLIRLGLFFIGRDI